MKTEMDAQLASKTLELVSIKEIPKGAAILPAVWQMKRKRRINTREVYKWKARLNLDGSRQVKGVHYDLTFAPVASWSVIRLYLVLILGWKWKVRQLDFIMAFTQAPTERPMYMEIPKGYTVSEGDRKDFILEILVTISQNCQFVFIVYLT